MLSISMFETPPLAGRELPVRRRAAGCSSSTSRDALTPPAGSGGAFSRRRALCGLPHPVPQFLATRVWLDIAGGPFWSAVPAPDPSSLVRSLPLGGAFALGACACGFLSLPRVY